MGEIWTLNTSTPCRNDQSSTRFLYLNSIWLCFTFLIGTSANLLVCWVACRNKALRTGGSVLLLNLAVGDLLRCLLDSPLFLLLLVLTKKHVNSGSALRCLQQFTYLLCSCVQLLTLAAISVERYQTISSPFSSEKRRRMRFWILLIWTCALTVSLISIIYCKEPLSFLTSFQLWTELKASDSDLFSAYVLVPVWTLSIILITAHYLRIFIIVRQHANKIFDTGIQPRLSVMMRDCSAPESGGAEGKYPGSVPELVGAVCVLTPRAKELGKTRVEGKLAKRLGYIITTVFLFWMPLVLIQTLKLLMDCTTCCEWVMQELETLAMVMTSVPATVDPLIYTLLHRHFRTEFRKIFCTNQSCL